MTPSNKDFLSRHDIKYTVQRELILTILKELTVPITAEELYTKASTLQPTINLSTIYRILELFATKNIVIKNTVSEDKKNVYEFNTNKHKHYMVCVKCRQVFPIENCPCSLIEKVISQSTDFKILDHKIEILGHCPDCK